MKNLGPQFVAVLTIDLHLTGLFLVVNVAFAFSLTAILFRQRPVIDRWLIFIGLAFVVNVLGLAATSLYARAPIRDLVTFAVD